MEITFEFSNGRILVICRLEEDTTWSATILNRVSFKSKKLFKGAEDKLSSLISVLIEMDRNCLLKDGDKLSVLHYVIKQKWKEFIINNNL